MFSTLSGFFGRIMKPLNAFIKGSRMLTGVSTVFKMLGRIFYPITLLFGAFKGIRTAIDDVGAQEGGIFSKIVAGIIGFAKGFFGFVVGGLLDAIKGAFAFILDKIGLTSAADILKSFNFTELIGKAFDGIKNAIFRVVEFVKNFVPALFAGISAAVKNLFTSPVESFKEAFKLHLNHTKKGFIKYRCTHFRLSFCSICKNNRNFFNFVSKLPRFKLHFYLESVTHKSNLRSEHIFDNTSSITFKACGGIVYWQACYYFYIA